MATIATRCRPIGVGAVRRPGAEDARLGARAIAARVNDQDGAVGPIQPGQEQHLLAHLQIAQAGGDGGFEDQPGLGRPLVSLPGSAGPIDQRRLRPADRPQRRIHDRED